MQTSLQITNFENIKQPTGTTEGVASLPFRVISPKLYATKQDQAIFFPGKLTNNARNKDSLEHYTAVVLDYDAGLMSFDKAKGVLIKAGIGGLMFTTARHKPDTPRFKIILPCSERITDVVRHEIAGQVNALFGGVFGSDTFDWRITYIGKVVGSDYRASVLNGDYVDTSLDVRLSDPVYPVTHKEAANDAQSGDDWYNEAKAVDALPDSEIPAMRSALAYLAGKGHADDTNLWRAVGLSLKNSGDIGFNLFDEFSQLSDKYDKATIKQDWQGLKGQVTGYASIFKKAVDLGWINPCKAQPILTKGFKLTALSDIPTTRPPKQWLIKKTLEPRKLHTLIGESGAGKSFIALDMAWHVAHGIDWNGHSVKAKGDVVYIAGEGAEGVIDRCSALSKHYGQPMPDNYFVSDQGINFDVEADVKMLVDVVKSCSASPALVIIDTLHRNFSADENSAKDIAALLKKLDAYLRVELGAAVLLVHHSGHGDKDRGRGSSAIRAAVDVELVAKKDKDGLIVLSCSKAKDFAAGEPLSFKLQTVELNHADDDGEQVTSAVPIYLGHAFKKTKELKPDNQEALAILETMLTQSGEVNATLTERLKANSDDPFDEGQGKEVKAVRLADWKAKVRDWLKRDNPNMTVNYLRLKLKRLCDDLIKSGNVVTLNDFVTLPVA